MRYSLMGLFALMTLVCVVLAFPKFFGALGALLLGVVIAGTIFTLIVMLPIGRILDALASLFSSAGEQPRQQDSADDGRGEHDQQ